MIQTNDDGFAIVGYGDHPLYGTESRLVKTDSKGNLLWNKTYGEPNESSIVLSIVQADDCGYALAGSTRGDMWLVRTDSNGDVQWEERYGGQNGDDCSSVVRTIDGGYLLAGSTASFGAGDSDGWVVKCDSQGNMQWSKTYGETGRDGLRGAIQARNGGYVLVGRTDTISSPAGVVVKLSASGELEWEKSLGDNTPESVTVASDGGYIFVGYKGEPTNRDNEVWAVKIAPDSGAQETVPLYATWIVVAVVITVAGLGLGLLIYLMKRNR